MHAELEERLAGLIARNQVPHIIFHGANGTGKRTLILNMINKIYGTNRRDIATNVQFVNCAHTKGIKYIREDIKNFAKTNVQNGRVVPFKSIVLFNADYLTVDAQSALRRSIELFSNNTRFFIVVRDKHRLLTPILSRFCEIYVAAPARAAHAHAPATTPSFDKNIIKTQLDEFYAARHIDVGLPTKMVAAVSKWYALGLSAFDIHRVIHSLEWLNEEETANTLLFYSRVRGDIKNDSMLMYMLLDFILFRSNADLNIIV